MHFFGRDLKEFYIATKDVASGGSLFQTYDTFRETIKSHPDIDITEGIVQLDLMSRLFRLTNFGNFGFVKMADTNNYKLKIIDFGFSQDVSYQINRDHFNGLKVGNGSYTYTDPKMIDILKEQEEKIRIPRAYNQFKILDKNFKEINFEALTQNIMSTINNIELDDENLKQIKVLLENLTSYQNNVKQNFESFNGFFEEYLINQVN